MSRLTFYRANGACSLAPHAVLKELGLPYEGVVMGSSPKSSIRVEPALQPEEYRKIHPQGFVPALKVDDNVITENPAILTYLAQQKPERKLLGSSTMDQAQVISWLTYLTGTLHGQSYGMLFRPGRFTDDENQHDAVREKGRARVQDCYEAIEKRLGGRDFAVGDADTVADFYLFVFFTWGWSHGFDMSKYPGYSNLAKRMQQKESVKATLQEEGIQPMFT
ncbi:hypothetical protein NM208_g135 [Fusarium decemcellulare]|uniref:Uncharacterized protein n=1 Tax=Fusarium decemcellulare TaxID=57161 RepID=A0ACC1T0D2_9HYPO|nr:hypothetical protein NM208_g135 [Fusarium decemcellulare]